MKFCITFALSDNILFNIDCKLSILFLWFSMTAFCSWLVFSKFIDPFYKSSSIFRVSYFNPISFISFLFFSFSNSSFNLIIWTDLSFIISLCLTNNVVLLLSNSYTSSRCRCSCSSVVNLLLVIISSNCWVNLLISADFSSDIALDLFCSFPFSIFYFSIFKFISFKIPINLSYSTSFSFISHSFWFK